MKNHIAVEIPTKKYIRAFVLKQLGERSIVNRETAIGSKLIDLLYQHRDEEAYQFRNKRYDCTMRLYINMHLFRQRGCFLNKTNIKNFNLFAEDMLKERFYWMMDFFIEIFPSFEKNLPFIREQLGIDDEEWSNNSMQQDYYRYRKRTGKPMLYKKNFTLNVLPEWWRLDGF